MAHEYHWLYAGVVKAPAVLMLNEGALGLMGGLVGHALYGLVVALVYAPFVG